MSALTFASPVKIAKEEEISDRTVSIRGHVFKNVQKGSSPSFKNKSHSK